MDERKFKRGVCDSCCDTDVFVTEIQSESMCEKCIIDFIETLNRELDRLAEEEAGADL